MRSNNANYNSVIIFLHTTVKLINSVYFNHCHAFLPLSNLMGGWVTCDFASFLVNKDDGRLIMTGFVQWNSVYD